MDALWQTVGLAGQESVKLYKTIQLMRHVQGESAHSSQATMAWQSQQE